MKLEGVKISGPRRLIHGSHGPIKPSRRRRLMQPKLRVGDGLVIDIHAGGLFLPSCQCKVSLSVYDAYLAIQSEGTDPL